MIIDEEYIKIIAAEAVVYIEDIIKDDKNNIFNKIINTDYLLDSTVDGVRHIVASIELSKKETVLSFNDFSEKIIFPICMDIVYRTCELIDKYNKKYSCVVMKTDSNKIQYVNDNGSVCVRTTYDDNKNILLIETMLVEIC